MAKHRIRRWFQFGILDLLILTTVVAIGAVLWRPTQAMATRAPPWLLGYWGNDDAVIGLMPDGSYFRAGRAGVTWKFPWRISRFADDKFALECGDLRLIVRSDWGSSVIEVFNEDGTANSRLEQYARVEGSWREGAPDGTWTITAVHVPLEDTRAFLQYRCGEPVDIRRSGERHLADLNEMRRARGLIELTNRDFPDEGPEKRP